MSNSSFPVTFHIAAKSDWSISLSLSVLTFFHRLLQYCKPWITPRDPYKVWLLMLEVLPRSKEKSWHNKEKVELLDRYHSFRSIAVTAFHFKINESSVGTIIKEKEISDAMAAATRAGVKTLHFCDISFILYWKGSF